MASQRIKVEVPDPFLPLFKPARYKVLYGGRGSGKSWSVARALVALAAAKPIRVLCARETQKSIQESVHRLLKDQIGLLGLEDKFEVQETRILGRNGSDFQFAGIRQQGVANLKSFEGVDVCWVEEAQVVSKRSWDVLIPTIRKPGSEIWITFNPELDSDETFERFVLNPPEGAWIRKANWDSNPWFPQVLDQERRDLERRDPVAYKTVWEGECRPAVEGAIYGRELTLLQEQGRVRAVPYDPLLKVHTFWDLGWNDETSIVMVQRAASEVRVIDHISGSYQTLNDYVRQLEAKDYRWGTDFLPHDGNSRSVNTGKSAKEILEQLGRRVEIVPRMDVEEGIQATRLLFPRCYFDAEKTAKLLQSLKKYRRQMSQSTGAFGAPLHDDASHDADAFRYMCVSENRMTNEDWGAQPIVYRNRRVA
jgi:phage terminase large subunit